MTKAGQKYDQQRSRRTPPHLSLADLRLALGLTIDQVIQRMTEDELLPADRIPSRATVSAIEHGHRGASEQMLAALTAAYGLRPGAITTNYEPRVWDEAPVGASA